MEKRGTYSYISFSVAFELELGVDELGVADVVVDVVFVEVLAMTPIG